MEVNILDQGQWEKIVEVTVPYEELTAKFDEAYLKYKKTVQLEGFRKGKVPVDLLKKVFGTKIEKEAAEKAVADYLEEAIKQKSVELYEVTKLDLFHYDRKSGLQFKALIKTRPEVHVEKYKGLSVEKENYQVTDDDIREVIENLREQQATMTNIEGAAQRGHYIVADVQKTDATGVPIIGQKYENHYLQLNGEGDDNLFVQQLIGVKPGDTRRITMPSDITAADGSIDQSGYYSVTVKEVKAKNLPQIDDEFAKDIGNFENLDALNRVIQQDLERQARENARQNLHSRIIDEVVKSNPIELPDYMIENFLDAFIENVKKENQEKIDEHELRERYRADAIWNLKWIMLKDKISELEKIQVDENEVTDYIEVLARQAGKNAMVVRSNYRDKKKREQIKLKIQEKKVLDLLLGYATITDTIVTYRDRQKARELIL